MVLTLNPADEILSCDYSSGSYLAVLNFTGATVLCKVVLTFDSADDMNSSVTQIQVEAIEQHLTLSMQFCRTRWF